MKSGRPWGTELRSVAKDLALGQQVTFAGFYYLGAGGFKGLSNRERKLTMTRRISSGRVWRPTWSDMTFPTEW